MREHRKSSVIILSIALVTLGAVCMMLYIGVTNTVARYQASGGARAAALVVCARTYARDTAARAHGFRLWRPTDVSPCGRCCLPPALARTAHGCSCCLVCAQAGAPAEQTSLCQADY